jgi:transcriptional regulator with XRE-family HTH domain
MNFGEKLRELREAKGLSLRELAEKVGCSAAFLSDVELGRRHTSDQLFVKIAQVLGIPVAELRTYDTRPPIKDLRTLVAADPAYGIALRKVIDKKVSAEDLMKLAEKKSDRKKKQ